LVELVQIEELADTAGQTAPAKYLQVVMEGWDELDWVAMWRLLDRF